MIKVKNISKIYPKAQRKETLKEEISLFWKKGDKESLYALDQVSFEVGPGERIGIIGKNGAGKSTLLKLLSRVTAPTKGEIEIRGRVGALLEVGAGFHPELTGRENIYLSGAILGMRRSAINRQFEAIVEFAEIGPFLDTPIKKYSSGMFLRLAFSVIAYLESEILIIDEVLSVGDAAFQKKCLEKMEEIASQGRTLFFVSHHLETLKALSSRALWLEEGRLLRDGLSTELLKAYCAPLE